MKNHVTTISVNATVAGKRLAVEGATLSLGVNDIPTIELHCAPSDASAAKPLSPVVVKPKLSDFSELYNDLAKKAEGMEETGNVSIVVHDHGGAEDGSDRVQDISLNGWVLTGAGLSSVSATAAPYLSVVLQHPICNLMKFGSIYETAKTSENDKLDEATAGADTFLKIVDAVYDCVNDTIEYWPVDSGKGLAEQFRAGLKSNKPSEYLSESATSLFLANGDLKKKIAQAIGRMVIPNDGGSSTWDMIVSTSGQLLQSVVQDESNNFTTGTLLLEPTQPWKIASITLDEKDCYQTEVPGMNPYRIAGVMARKRGPFNDLLSLGLIRNGNACEKGTNTDVLYSPVENPSASDGRIMKIAAPAILDSAFRRDAQHGATIALGTFDTSKESVDGYNEVVEKYAKAVYEISVRSMVRATATMAIWFKDGSERLILPGQTCKFVSGGKPVYYGYIQRVVHNVSISGVNSTTVAMSHVRPTPGLEGSGGTLVEAGAPNAAYT